MSSAADPTPGTSDEQIDTEFKDCHDEDKKIYELQLTQLQEQLVAAMIENQTLGMSCDIFPIYFSRLYFPILIRIILL